MPLTFTKDGSLSVNSYLRIDNVVGPSAGYKIVGNSRLIGVSVSCQTAATSGGLFTLRYRSVLSTWLVVTGSDCPLVSGQYSAAYTYDIVLPTDVELTMYYSLGSSLTNVVATAFIRLES